MTRTGKIAAMLAAAMLSAATAMPAQAAPLDNAEKLRKLDIMLMVTGLRCRTTPDDFQRDFQAFEAAHLDILNGATSDLRNSLVERYGLTGASRALDRISTAMANRYGQGHPALSCGELKAATRALARIRGKAELVVAAERLLMADSASHLAFAGR
jgi:hypothetical protein